MLEIASIIVSFSGNSFQYIVKSRLQRRLDCLCICFQKSLWCFQWYWIEWSRSELLFLLLILSFKVFLVFFICTFLKFLDACIDLGQELTVNLLMFLHQERHGRFTYCPCFVNEQLPPLIIYARLIDLSDVDVLNDFNHFCLNLLSREHDVVGHDTFENLHRVEFIEQGLQLRKVFCL